MRIATLLVLMSIAGSVSAKQVLICETGPKRMEAPVLTQETRFVCPGVAAEKTLPELYRDGWRLIQYGSNNRFSPSNQGLSELTLVVVLEKD